MKKKLFSVLLICVMVFAFAAPVMAADALQHGDVAALLNTDAAKIAIPAEKTATDTLTQEEAAAYLLLWSGMDESQLGVYPADWNAMALSAAIVDLDDFDPSAACTKAEFDTMKGNTKALYDALHADKMKPYSSTASHSPSSPTPPVPWKKATVMRIATLSATSSTLKPITIPTATVNWTS